MQIPWYYMWSENYRFFHEIVKDSMKEPEFELRPIEIAQSCFDKELYKVEGKHHWEGSFIKIDLLIDRLKEAIEQSEPYILFTDVDLVVKPGVYQGLKTYIDDGYEMVFLKEGEQLNIGFILLRTSQHVIDFWKGIRKMMEEKEGHDQAYVNQAIHAFTGKYTTFDDQIFTCSNTWNCTTEFAIMQVLCSCLGKEFNMAEKIFSTAQHIDIQSYMQYVKEDIIPYIYKFQELLYKSHQIAKEDALN
jgi:hypothetical protein